jgi:hypothetical protein
VHFGKLEGTRRLRRVLNRQIASLQSSPGIPNLSGYDSETRKRHYLLQEVAEQIRTRREVEGLLYITALPPNGVRCGMAHAVLSSFEYCKQNECVKQVSTRCR